MSLAMTPIRLHEFQDYCSCTAANTIVLLINMGAVSYAYECKYSGCSCRLPCKM